MSINPFEYLKHVECYDLKDDRRTLSDDIGVIEKAKLQPVIDKFYQDLKEFQERCDKIRNGNPQKFIAYHKRLGFITEVPKEEECNVMVRLDSEGAYNIAYRHQIAHGIFDISRVISQSDAKREKLREIKEVKERQAASKNIFANSNAISNFFMYKATKDTNYRDGQSFVFDKSAFDLGKSSLKKALDKIAIGTFNLDAVKKYAEVEYLENADKGHEYICDFYYDAKKPGNKQLIIDAANKLKDNIKYILAKYEKEKEKSYSGIPIYSIKKELFEFAKKLYPEDKEKQVAVKSFLFNNFKLENGLYLSSFTRDVEYFFDRIIDDKLIRMGELDPLAELGDLKRLWDWNEKEKENYKNYKQGLLTQINGILADPRYSFAIDGAGKIIEPRKLAQEPNYKKYIAVTVMQLGPFREALEKFKKDVESANFTEVQPKVDLEKFSRIEVRDIFNADNLEQMNKIALGLDLNAKSNFVAKMKEYELKFPNLKRVYPDLFPQIEVPPAVTPVIKREIKEEPQPLPPPYTAPKTSPIVVATPILPVTEPAAPVTETPQQPQPQVISTTSITPAKIDAKPASVATVINAEPEVQPTKVEPKVKVDLNDEKKQEAPPKNPTAWQKFKQCCSKIWKAFCNLFTRKTAKNDLN